MGRPFFIQEKGRLCLSGYPGAGCGGGKPGEGDRDGRPSPAATVREPAGRERPRLSPHDLARLGAATVGGMFSTPGQLALEGRLAGLIAQRTVLADAVANVDTPGYQPAAAAAFAPALQAAIAAQLGVPQQVARATAALAPNGLAVGTVGATIAPTPVGLLSATGAAGGTSGTLASLAASSPTGPPAGTVLPVSVPAPGAVTPDGNGVGLDATMAALATNDLGYQAVLRQLQLTYQNISAAIDVGGA